MAESDVKKPLVDSEVFQIDDFTVITPLEMLISQIEMTIHDWGLGKGTANNNFVFEKGMGFCIEWDSRSEKITLNENHALNLTHYWPKNMPRAKIEENHETEIDHRENFSSYFTDSLKLIAFRDIDFIPGSIITSQFGILEFLLITPYIWSNDMIKNESQLNFISSAVNVAISNAECDIPMFVQYGAFDRHIYLGVSQNDSVRTAFLTSSIARPLTRHSNINGLKEVFLSRMRLPYTHKIDATVSVMVDYTLREKIAISQAISSAKGDYEEYAPETIFVGNTSFLSFGAISDLVEKITISSLWLDRNLQWFTEDEDNEWDPFEAPDVYAYVNFFTGVPCLLHQNLRGLLDASSSTKGKERISVLLEEAGYTESNLGRNALASLAPPQTISITNHASVENREGLNEDLVFRWVDAIFIKCDDITNESNLPLNLKWSVTGSSRAPGGAVKQKIEGINKPEVTKSENINHIAKECISILEDSKSAPFNSLTARIATALTQVLRQHETGVLAFAQLWVAIVRELRDKWENNQYLPGIDSPFTPDQGMCRLHQKLQMLQCCIDNRVKRHQQLGETTSMDQSSDEYFDANDWLSEISEDEENAENIDETNLSLSAQGRKCQSDLFLIRHPKIPIYEPYLQERCPMTEDMLEKYTDYLTSFSSSESRVKAQLESLRSDMQAFKAANPGCIFEDFIRWHSPRDYIANETGEKGLSNRMQGEDNIWIETWREASPQPIKYQRRLFNESKEAESILQELMSFTVADLVISLLPIVIKCAAKQLIEEASQMSPVVDEKLIGFFKKVLSCTYTTDPELYLDVLRELYVIELKISQFNSLWTRFSNVAGKDIENKRNAELLRNFIQSLLDASHSSTKFGALGGGEASIRCMVQIQNDRQLSFPGMVMEKLFRDAQLFMNEESSEARASKDATNITEERRMLPYSRKQYIFRCKASLPNIGSRPAPQRMYFSMSQNGQFRMGTALTEDIVLQ